MVKQEELNESINWLHKLQAADNIAGNKYSQNAIELAHNSDKHINAIREGKGYVESAETVNYFPKIDELDMYLNRLTDRIEHIKEGNKPIKETDEELDMNTIYRRIIRLVAGMSNEIGRID